MDAQDSNEVLEQEENIPSKMSQADHVNDEH